MYFGALALYIDDATVFLKLLKARGARSRDNGDIMLTDAGEVECEGTSNSTNPEYGDAQLLIRRQGLAPTRIDDA
jgi:hypothetical protein